MGAPGLGNVPDEVPALVPRSRPCSSMYSWRAVSQYSSFQYPPPNSGKEPTRVKNADGHSNTDGMRRMTK